MAQDYSVQLQVFVFTGSYELSCMSRQRSEKLASGTQMNGDFRTQITGVTDNTENK